MTKGVTRVRALPEQVFSTLTKYAEYPLWVPGCRRVTVLASAGNQTDVEIVQVAMKTVTAVLRFQADPPTGLRFEMIKGTDFKSYSGRYRLMVDADGSGTVVMSEVQMDMGMMMPRFLVDEKVRQFLDEFGKALEKRVASTAVLTAAMPAPGRTGHRPAARRLLRITRTATGFRISYLGRIYEVAESQNSPLALRNRRQRGPSGV